MNKVIVSIFATAVVTAFAVSFVDAQTPTNAPSPTTVPQGAPGVKP